MELKQHPEHDLYREHRQQMEDYRRAVTAWLAGDRARAQVESLFSGLIPLLQTYNRILWQHFPYCSQCLGGCCVAGATDLKPIDYVALAFLNEALPTRPERTGLDARACIYLTPQGCSWPTRWRPLKCAFFYCLGSGAIAVDASDARYAEITEALQAAIAPGLARLLPDLCDGPRHFELGDRKFCLVHDAGPLPHDDEMASDIIVSGHTHEPRTETRGDTLYLNPGECCGWLTGVGRVSLLDTATLAVENLAVHQEEGFGP